MNDALNNAKQKAEYIKEQEDQIKWLLAEIDNTRRQIELAKAEIRRLEHEIKLANEEIERLMAEIDDLNWTIKKLEGLILEREDELNWLIAVLNDRNIIYEALMAQLGSEPQKEIKYQAAKGDLVDEMLARYINIANCPVPIKRLGGGYYLFGTKKIYAKILNGRLVIRVGGGYMVIDEFIQTYA